MPILFPYFHKPLLWGAMRLWTIMHPHRTAPTLKEEITALEVYLSHPLLGTSAIAGLTGKPTVIILECVVM